MSIQAHLEALRARHKACEAQLAEAIAHTSTSDQEITGIKHRKLQLKDEIFEIEARMHATAAA
jgi:hypothetical protein